MSGRVEAEPGRSEEARAGAKASPWAPLKVRIFRAIWLAALVSNLGSWMHMVSASWPMTSLTASAALVALLSTATAVPSFALAMPAGALADTVDRRRMVILPGAVRLNLECLYGDDPIGAPFSYRRAEPGWRPTLPSARSGEFTMADLLVFAGASGRS